MNSKQGAMQLVYVKYFYAGLMHMEEYQVREQ